MAEYCTGSDATCPADVYMPASTVCRESSGPCDTPEICTGTSTACPSDVVKPATTICRVNMGDCDVEEMCTGASASCPTDKFLNASTVCREVSDECDTADFCSGSSGQCGTDNFLASGTACNVSGCPLPSQCSGTASSCPVISCEGATNVVTNLTFPGDFSAVFQSSETVQQLNASLAADYKKTVGVDGVVTYMAEGSLIAIIVASIPKSRATLLKAVKARTNTLATAPNWYSSVVATCDAAKQASCSVGTPSVRNTVTVIPPPPPPVMASAVCGNPCIIGIAAGIGFIVIVIVAVAAVCYIRRRRSPKVNRPVVAKAPIHFRATFAFDHFNEPIDENTDAVEEVFSIRRTSIPRV